MNFQELFPLEIITDLIPETISNLPPEVIVFIVFFLIGIIISIIKKTLKVFLLLLLVLVLLLILEKITIDYFQFF